ncbi:glycosyltransferase family 2 protein [Dyadobacter pollutisoli]|nr:glycosyltransferase family 2 protein [Dyadobacter pollutisoli]
MNKFPKFSIITVSYNSEKYIEETIKSVISQSYPNIEYIIIDGESTDGTIDIIKKYESQITYWASEKDQSMYDAINKGLRKCTGDFIWVINSDDYIPEQDTVQNILIHIQKYPNELGYYADVFIREGSNIRLRRSLQVTKKQLLLSMHGTFIPHPALIVTRKSLDFVHEYNLKYKYASDFDYIFRLLDSGTLRHLKIPISVFRRHTESITSSGKLNYDRLEILRDFGYKNYNVLDRRLTYLFIWIKYKIINYL